MLAVSLAGGLFCWGLVYSKITTVPEIIVQKETRDISRYIERPTVEVVEVEKEVPVQLRHFGSEEELIEWLHADKTDELTYIEDRFECEDFSQTLMNNAVEDGLYMSFQVLKNYTRPETKEFIKGPHAINSTIIGNYIYFIDPQNDELWRAYVLEEETI